MTEDKWGHFIMPKLNKLLKAFPGDYEAEYRSRLSYRNEVIKYKNDTPQCKEGKYETDILIFEWIDHETWMPRVVIELKVENFSYRISWSSRTCNLYKIDEDSQSRRNR